MFQLFTKKEKDFTTLHDNKTIQDNNRLNRKNYSMVFLGKSHKYTTISVSQVWQNYKKTKQNKQTTDHKRNIWRATTDYLAVPGPDLEIRGGGGEALVHSDPYM